jgi:hypothetical protein
MHTFLYIYEHIYIYIHIYIHTHVYIYIYTYIYTQILTHICVCVCLFLHILETEHLTLAPCSLVCGQDEDLRMLQVFLVSTLNNFSVCVRVSVSPHQSGLCIANLAILSSPSLSECSPHAFSGFHALCTWPAPSVPVVPMWSGQKEANPIFPHL